MSQTREGERRCFTPNVWAEAISGAIPKNDIRLKAESTSASYLIS